MDGSQLTVLLERAVRAGQFPGASALAVAPRTRVRIVKGWGRVTPPAVPASEDCLYDLASLTKPLAIATLFLLARREGLLDLDTRVGDLLDEASGGPCGALSMVQLLTHTSGLPGWAPLYGRARGSRRRALEALLTIEPIGPPGAQVIYSCLGYILLGWVLERAFDEPLDAAFRRFVARPLGIEKELLFRPDPRLFELAGGARQPGEVRLLGELGLADLVQYLPPWEEGLPDDGNARFLGGVAGNAGLWGTAHAVATVTAQYFPGDGGILQEGERQVAIRPFTAGLEQSRGLGWQLAATPGCSAGPALPPGAFGHTGFTGTSVWADPGRREVFVLLSNRHHPAHRGIDLHPLRRRFHVLARQLASTAPDSS